MLDRLVIFDCDGVLVDSEVLVVEIEADLLAAAGFPVAVPDLIDRFVGLSYADMMRALERDFGRPVPAGLSERIQADALAAFPERLRPIPGMAELLAGLELARCVASSSKVDRITLSLAVTGLDEHFAPEHVFSSQMVERGKPAPDLFELAARTLGARRRDCVVIEDSPHGVAAGVAAGMEVIGFVGGGHAGDHLADRLTAAGAAVVVDHAEAIVDHL